jgi:hypothetical protein
MPPLSGTATASGDPNARIRVGRLALCGKGCGCWSKSLDPAKKHEKRCNGSTTDTTRVRKKIREYGGDALEKQLCTKGCGSSYPAINIDNHAEHCPGVVLQPTVKMRKFTQGTREFSPGRKHVKCRLCGITYARRNIDRHEDRCNVRLSILDRCVKSVD